MTADVPMMPSVETAMLEEHRAARLAVSDALDQLPVDVQAIYRWWFRRRLAESVANAHFDDRPLLIPPRRRQLGNEVAARLSGCTTALRHVDARCEMVRRGHLASVVAPETPYVLNALAESHNPGGLETNPGLPRLTESEFNETQTDYLPALGSQCEALTHAATQVASSDPAPAIVRAGWLCATLLAVHPFVDGNGRSSRLLFQLLSSADPELGFDWGALEQWAMYRRPYVGALKATQAPSVPRYNGELIDTMPFVLFGVSTSTEGARIAEQRVEWFGSAWKRVTEDHDEVEHAVIEVAVASAWSTSLDELDELLGGASSTPLVNELVRRRRLVWDRRGLLGLAEDHPLASLR